MSRLERLAMEGLDYHAWYHDAWCSIRTVCEWKDYNPYLFAAVLASTSPRTTVRRNIRNTLHWFDTRTLLPGTMSSTQKAVERLGYGRIHLIDRLRGPKVTKFYLALIGDRDAVTLDSWMSHAFKLITTSGKPMDWTPSRRHKAEQAVRRVARKLHLSPRDTQAAIWTGQIRRAGRKPRRLQVIQEHLNRKDWQA